MKFLEKFHLHFNGNQPIIDLNACMNITVIYCFDIDMNDDIR